MVLTVQETRPAEMQEPTRVMKNTSLSVIKRRWVCVKTNRSCGRNDYCRNEKGGEMVQMKGSRFKKRAMVKSD